MAAICAFPEPLFAAEFETKRLLHRFAVALGFRSSEPKL